VRSVCAAELRSIAVEFYEALAQHEFQSEVRLVVGDGEQLVVQDAVRVGDA